MSGPFKATKLWNETVQSFYHGMPLSRHWRGLKQYENCFTASDAISWLHNYLKESPNFSSNVSKEQTIKLLRKFLKCSLIVGVRGNRILPEEFQNNRELFRFGNQSPMKSFLSPSRIPLAPISMYGHIATKSSANVALRNQDYMKSPILKSNYDNAKYDNEVNEAVKENFHPYANVPFTEDQVNDAWCHVYIERFWEIYGRLLGGQIDNQSMIIPNSKWIRENLGVLNPVTSWQKCDLSSAELPRWVYHAMKSLVQWPNTSDIVCKIPNYPGVEMDIFKIVKDYFAELALPLIPFEMYFLIIKIYTGAEMIDILNRTNNGSGNNSLDNSTLSSHNSVEDLMLDLSVNCPSEKQKCSNSSESPDFSNNLNSKCDGPRKSSIPSLPDTNSSPLLIDKWSSIPRSLKFNRLYNYTDFKDEYMYPESGESPLTFVNNYAEGFVKRGFVDKLVIPLIGESNLTFRNGKETQTQAFDDRSQEKFLRSDELEDFWLPPNSCFETAFTSDSPKTRIIPQKSVDTIHLKNCGHSVRPKSIAVSTLPDDASEKADQKHELSSNSIHIQDFNRSVSEGNLTLSEIQNDGKDNRSVKSLSISKRNKISRPSIVKSSLASRVRDSIKRKKAKDSQKHSNNRLQHTIKPYKDYKSETPDISAGINSSEHPDMNVFKKPREKFSNCSDPIPLSFTQNRDPDNENRNLNINYQSPIIFNNSRDNSIKSLRNSPSEINSDFSSSQNKSYSSSIDNNSYANVNKSFKSRQPRSHTCTPNGCLSHSLETTTPSSSLYHSALSGFNQTPTPFESASLTDSSKSTNSLSPTASLPPELPKRKPYIQYTPKCSSPLQVPNSPNYENLRELSEYKVISCSANELSDSWADRVPYGSISPYFSGGFWKHYESSPSKRLICRKNKINKRCSTACVFGLLTRVGKQACIEALQMLFLNMDPVRRYKLRLLLKMMQRVSSNERLRLHSSMEPSNRATMVTTFCRYVLRSENENEYDELLSQRIVAFLMDNHEAVFNPPKELAVLAHRRLNSAFKSNVLSNQGICKSPSVAFCRQVSPASYRNQKLTGSQQFLFELLKQIVDDSVMTDKEKRKKLKDFKFHYPEIYGKMYPLGCEHKLLHPSNNSKPKLKTLKKLASFKSLTLNKPIRI